MYTFYRNFKVSLSEYLQIIFYYLEILIITAFVHILIQSQ